MCPYETKSFPKYSETLHFDLFSVDITKLSGQQQLLHPTEYFIATTAKKYNIYLIGGASLHCVCYFCVFSVHVTCTVCVYVRVCMYVCV